MLEPCLFVRIVAVRLRHIKDLETLEVWPSDERSLDRNLHLREGYEDAELPSLLAYVGPAKTMTFWQAIKLIGSTFNPSPMFVWFMVDLSVPLSFYLRLLPLSILFVLRRSRV